MWMEWTRAGRQPDRALRRHHQRLAADFHPHHARYRIQHLRPRVRVRVDAQPTRIAPREGAGVGVVVKFGWAGFGHGGSVRCLLFALLRDERARTLVVRVRSIARGAAWRG